MEVSGYLWRDPQNDEYQLFAPAIAGAYCTFKINGQTIQVQRQTIQVQRQNATGLKRSAGHFVTLQGQFGKLDPSQAYVDMIPAFAELRDVRILQIGRPCKYKERYKL